MANADAFNQGFDAGMGKSKKSKKSKLLSQPTPGKIADPGEYKHGGKVKRTGYARVHKNEVVLTAARAKTLLGKKRGKKKVSRKRVSSKG